MAGQQGQRQTVRDAAAGKPGTAVAKTEGLSALIDRMTDQFKRQLPASIPPQAFARTVLTGLKEDGKLASLAKTDEGTASLMAALLEAARYGLMPFTDEAAIVYFGGNRPGAVMIPEYKGLIKTWINSGQVAAVELRMIHKADDWALTYGDGGGFYHRPALVDGNTGEPIDRGRPILAYCYAKFRDGSMSSVTTVTEAEARQTMEQYSKSYRLAEQERAKAGGQPDWKPGDYAKGWRPSTWHTEFPKMWRKTAARWHSAVMPRSPEMLAVLMAAARDDVDAPPASNPPVITDFDMEGDVVWDSAAPDAEPAGAPS